MNHPRLALLTVGVLALASCGTASTATLAQQEHGDGWRLLLDDTVGSPYEVHAATDATQFSLLWERLDQEGSPPQVDFASEVVVHFGAVVSGSCPEILFEDVVIDLGEGLVHGEFGSSIQVSGTRVCTADARPHAYVVAVERAVLPPSPFTIQLYDRVRCRGCDESEMMTVDLDGGTQSRLLVPDLSRADSRSPDVLYSGALVGTLRYDENLGCVWLETEGGPRSVLWPPGTELTTDPPALKAWNISVAPGDLLLVTGGRALEDVQPTVCAQGDWTWIASDLTQAPVEPTPPPREYTEPKWDQYYTPVVFPAGEHEVEIDRWPWALLADSGWTTIRRDGAILVEAPTEWMNGDGDLSTFINPYTGEIVAQLVDVGEAIAEYVAGLEQSQSD